MSIEEIKNFVLYQAEKAIEKVFEQKPKMIILTYPPDIYLGDFTIECFSLAKEFILSASNGSTISLPKLDNSVLNLANRIKKSSEEIAKKIKEEIKLNEIIEEVRVVGPYLNFKINKAFLFKEILSEIIEKGNNFGDEKEIGKEKQIMVEYLCPNTNKPLHIGHIRNGVLGMAVANLFQCLGNKVLKVNLNNDRGIHICKSMLAWQKWANGQTPELIGVKGDHFVGQWYIRYYQEANKNLEIEEELKKEAREMLQKWEAGNSEIIKLWQMMNKWAYQGFEETYKELGLKFDIFNYESETYKLGKEIVEYGLKKGIFIKTGEGAVIAELENSQKITLLRQDGTAVYITQDLGTAKSRFDNYQIDELIYVIGKEQDFYFKNLLKILEKLGFEWFKKMRHLSYGMINLPEGKMKSREGKVIDADDLISEMNKLAIEEIKKRHSELSLDEINERAKKIGIAAIKFYLLRVNPKQEIAFNPSESISFDGFTGPYCQYVYARASGILQKTNLSISDADKLKDIDFSVLNNERESTLLRYLIQFPEKIKLSANEFNPSIIAEHIFEIAKAFNNFYAFCPAFSAENENLKKARLILIKATAIAIKKGLELLGIEVLKKM